MREAIEHVTIDLSDAHFWDITSVAALEKLALTFQRDGAEAEVIGMNQASATIVDRFGHHDKPDQVARLLANS